MDRWTGSGSSTSTTSGLAGREAAAAALDAREDARLLIVFASDAHDLPALLAGIRAVSGEVPLVGCTTAGEIAEGGPGDSSVVVMALGGDFSVATSACRVEPDGLRIAGSTVAESASLVADRPHRALLLLSDGLAGDQEELVRGAYEVLGAGVPLVGGCAGDDLRMTKTAQFLDGQVLEGSVVAAALGSDAPLGIGVSHGWRRVGEPMMVTGSAGNRVLTLDDSPALDVYLTRLGAPPEAWTDPAAFTQFALTHPLGLSRRRGEEVRFVAEADFSDRSLGCVARVPRGGLTWFMEGDDASVMQATDDACAEALAPLEGRPPIGMLAFDCIARRGVLQELGLCREVARIAQHAGDAPVAGFYTYGEIARTSGTGGFHNQTLVVLALG
ncbi:MAG: FIST N-terminal domain-containing protein [Mycobacteriales bacterium]|nr:FIST N-terminal domain-containing protein [Mycobacteriales bacterium]